MESCNHYPAVISAQCEPFWVILEISRTQNELSEPSFLSRDIREYLWNVCLGWGICWGCSEDLKFVVDFHLEGFGLRTVLHVFIKVCGRWFSDGVGLGCVGIDRVSRRLKSGDGDSITSVYGDLIVSSELCSLAPRSPSLVSLVFFVPNIPYLNKGHSRMRFLD